MKIGIISDIHGNLAQLDKALAVLRRKNVDQIICAGDLVDFGGDGNGVVKRIFDEQIPCVMGNHDRDARQNQALRQQQIEQGLKVELLHANTLALLALLPQKLKFTWQGISVHLEHANTWGTDEYVFPKATTPMFQRVVKQAQADVTILGHTHIPMWIQVDGKTIINAGSVSYNYRADCDSCGILSLPEMDFRLIDIDNGLEVELLPKMVTG